MDINNIQVIAGLYSDVIALYPCRLVLTTTGEDLKVLKLPHKAGI
jgi:hypothetical protein